MLNKYNCTVYLISEDLTAPDRTDPFGERVVLHLCLSLHMSVYLSRVGKKIKFKITILFSLLALVLCAVNTLHLLCYS